MAKRATSAHARALAAFTTKRISRAEYQAAVLGWAEVRRGSITGAYLTPFGKWRLIERHLGPAGSVA